MKTGLVLEQLVDRVERIERTKRDFIVPQGRMTAVKYDAQNPAVEIAVGSTRELFGITDFAHNQMAANLAIPREYYHRMMTEAPALWESSVNRWLADDKARLVRTADGAARAFLSKGYRAIDNYDLLSAILPELKRHELRVESCELTDRKLYLKAVAPAITGEIEVGDVVNAGIVISNSEVGAGLLQISPLLYRLRCKNGLIIPDESVRRRHVGKRLEEAEEAAEWIKDDTRAADDRAFFLKTRDLVAYAISDLHMIRATEKLRAAKGDRIEGHPEEAVEIVGKRFGLSDGERQSTLRHLIDDGDGLSRFGMLNAVTRMAQDVPSYDRSTELEATGADILGMASAEWKRLLN